MIKQFHLLAKITLILTFLVIIAGAVVRMTGSGMGCPDWPKCFGYYVPPTDIEQLLWQPNTTYKKDVVIIYKESLHLAKSDFTSSQTYSSENWTPYTKHDYAVFNPLHTWVEYINRLFGALAGLATLALAFFSLKFRKTHLKLTLLSWAVVFGMGFQAWLGKTVVDSNLSPFKITVHMVMALILVAALLYIIFKTSTKTIKLAKSAKQFKLLLGLTLILSLAQIILGTQVRQFIDEQIKSFGYEKSMWLNNPSISFYIHRSFSILIVALHAVLFYKYKKYFTQFRAINWIVLIVLLEVLTGIIMVNYQFPFSTQSLHLVFASLLFALQFYLLLQVHHSQTITTIKK